GTRSNGLQPFMPKRRYTPTPYTPYTLHTLPTQTTLETLTTSQDCCNVRFLPLSDLAFQVGCLAFLLLPLEFRDLFTVAEQPLLNSVDIRRYYQIAPRDRCEGKAFQVAPPEFPELKDTVQ